jgi:hypothetical protein
MHFYADSIRNKPVQMLNADHARGEQNQNQKKFGPSQRLFHSSSPFKQEFSALLESLSTKALEYLMTNQQKNMAKALWEACNYGNRPKPENFKDMEPLRDYQIWVLTIEHEQQWAAKALSKTQKNC